MSSLLYPGSSGTRQSSLLGRHRPSTQLVLAAQSQLEALLTVLGKPTASVSMEAPQKHHPAEWQCSAFNIPQQGPCPRGWS